MYHNQLNKYYEEQTLRRGNVNVNVNHQCQSSIIYIAHHRESL